jgi:hypothetical protein
MGEIQATVPATVQRLDPRRRVATVQLRRIGQGRTFRTDVALPTEKLAGVVEWGRGSSLGGVTAVRTTDAGETEVDLHVTSDSAWQRLAAGSVRVHAVCSFTPIGPDPRFGRVTKVEFD